MIYPRTDHQQPQAVEAIVNLERSTNVCGPTCGNETLSFTPSSRRRSMAVMYLSRSGVISSSIAEGSIDALLCCFILTFEKNPNDCPGQYQVKTSLRLPLNMGVARWRERLSETCFIFMVNRAYNAQSSHGQIDVATAICLGFHSICVEIARGRRTFTIATQPKVGKKVQELQQTILERVK